MSGPRSTKRVGSYVAWLGVGVLWSLALLGAFTIGIFIAPIALVATLVVATRPNLRCGIGGLLAGAALPLLYVAYLNRNGPGDVCSRTFGGESCTQELNPWPFIVGAVILVALSLLLALTAQRTSRV